MESTAHIDQRCGGCIGHCAFSSGMYLPKLIVMLFAVLMPFTAFSSKRSKEYNVSDDTYLQFQVVDKMPDTKVSLSVADSLAAIAKAKGDYATECLYLSIPVKYYSLHSDAQSMASSVDRLKADANLGGKSTDQWYFWALHQLALYKMKNDDYLEAIDIANDMHSEAVRRKSRLGLFSTMLLLGDIYRMRNDVGLSGENYLKAYEYQQQYLPDINIGQLCARLGEYYRRKSGRTKDDLAKSKEFVEKGLLIADDNLVRLMLMNEKAMSLYNEHDIDGFYEVYKSCDSLYSLLGEDPEFLQVKYRKSILDKDYNQAVAIAEGMINEYDRQIALYVINRARGNYEEALKNYEKANHSLNMIREKERRGDLEEISARLGNFELEQANTLLEQERTEAEGARMKAINSAVVTVLILVIIAFFGLLVFNRRIKSSNKLLAKNNEELAIARKHAEESDNMKMMFIQNMSHEIRTPLNAIVGFSMLLTDTEQKYSDYDLSEFRMLISSNCDMLTSIVDNILTISDLDSGKYIFEEAETNINHVCFIAIESIRSKVKDGVKLTFTSNLPDDYMAITDNLRLTQVINNMLANACTFTDAGEINLNVSTTGDGWLRIAVTDTGSGIDKEKSEEIFDRFVKLDPFKSGTGLGLNICKMIAEKLQGRIYLDTTYSGGSRFVLEIPVK